VTRAAVNRFCGRLMLGLSVFALLLVCGAVLPAMLGGVHRPPDADEGTAAHLFQLAVVLFAFTTTALVLTADWQRPRQLVGRLVIPAMVLAVAFLLLYVLEHTH
jgi:uncharacterized membrane protein YozB (DUF420 family)